MSDKIKVRITANAKVQFAQRVEITKEQLDRYDQIIAEPHSRMDAELNREFEHLINLAEVLDMDGLEDLEIEEVKE